MHSAAAKRMFHQVAVEKVITETEKCLHELFEAQAERTPEFVAVVVGDDQLSYRDLNRKANQLAHYLRNNGVGPDIPVGVCLERSTAMIVAVLAIQKAGGAYVPLDPDLPKERLAFMIEDVHAPLVITASPLSERLPKSRAHILSLDLEARSIAMLSCENLLRTTSPENLVYVMYTSGSTGQAKGVSIEHRQLVNYTGAIQSLLQLSPGSHYALVSTFAADLG